MSILAYNHMPRRHIAAKPLKCKDQISKWKTLTKK